MNSTAPASYTAFQGHRRLASGSLLSIALEVRQADAGTGTGSVLIFNDCTGETIDIDVRGSEAQLRARFAPAPPEARGRGRPKLGVIAREITLLPRHWEWLSSQPGGASVALRKLVDEARRVNDGKDRLRRSRERTYRFMHAMAGDMPGFEEVTRALFAGDESKFDRLIRKWPRDVREYAAALASGSKDPA